MKPSPFLLLIGPDPFLRELELKEIRGTLFPNGPDRMNDLTLHARDMETADILDQANTLPMFSEKRLLVIRGIEKLGEDDQTRWLKYVENPSPYAVIVGTAEKLDRRTRFFKAMDEKGCIRLLEEPRPRDLPAWVDRLAQKRDLKLSPDAKQALLEAVGTDLGSLDRHLEKLSLFVHPEKNVSAKEVAQLVYDIAGENLFAWTDQVVEGRVPDATATLNDLIRSGSPVLVLVSLLARHLRVLLRARDELAARTRAQDLPHLLGVPPFTVRRYMDQAQRFTKGRLRSSLGELSKLDRELKSTGLSPSFLLERTVRAIAHAR
ncbi:MAG: DNA polymerase III subunit delta [Pseudomonadota bacterium]